MKANFFTAIAALAANAFALPTRVVPAVDAIAQHLPTPSVSLSIPSSTPVSVPSAVASAIPLPSTSAAAIVHNVAPELKNVLTISGPDGKQLNIKFSPKVATLIASIGLPEVDIHVGWVVATADSVNDLIKSVAPEAEGLVTVVSKDLGTLLIKLSHEVEVILTALGLVDIAVPVGEVVDTVATVLENLKRDDVNAVGNNAELLLLQVISGVDMVYIQLNPIVAALFAAVGLESAATYLDHSVAFDGRVIATASNAHDLLENLRGPVTNYLTVTAADGSLLLIEMVPTVVDRIAGLSLPALGVPVGTVIKTVARTL